MHAVRIHRLHAQSELLRDLPIGVARAEEPQHLALASGEAVKIRDQLRGAAMGNLMNELLAECRTEIGLPRTPLCAPLPQIASRPRDW